MSNQMGTFRQGEDISFQFDLSGEPLDDWICTILVKQYPGDTAPINRQIPAVGRVFPGYLTSTETAALNVSSDSPWTITALMVNATEIRQRQVTKRFHLAPAFAP